MTELLAASKVLEQNLLVNHILKTKIVVPPRREDLVARPRLLEQLNKNSGGKLTLISAPPGFGKTTLLTEWCATLTQPVCWLNLDAADNDPTRFLTYVSAALEHVSPNLGELMRSMLYSLQPPPFETLFTLIINEVNRLDQKVTFIVDDCQTIENDVIYQAAAFLLKYLPSQLHLVLSTRREPLFSLASLRALGKLNEIRAEDLRFDRSETEIFLNQVTGLNLSPAAITKLESRTEGWIAGLQLAALSLQRRSDVEEYIEAFSGSHRHVIDYLAEEVLQRQPPEVQHFLLQTSLLSRLSAGLCEAVTGQNNAQKMLEELDKSNLFLVALDDRRGWYRYLSLFGDFLRAELEQTQPALLPELHRRAATWLAANNFPAEALEHALAVPDFEQASQIIVESAGQRLLRAEAVTILGWLQKLPPPLVENNLRLKLYQTWSLLLTLQLESAKEKADQMQVWLQAQAVLSAEWRDFQTEVMVIQTSIAALRRDLEPTIQLGRQVLTRLPAASIFLRSAVYWTLAYAYHMSGNLREAEKAYRAAIENAQLAGSISINLIALGGLGYVLALQGKLSEAAAIYQQAIELGSQPGKVVMPMTSLSIMSLGEVYYEWNDLEPARACLDQAIELCAPTLNEILLESYLIMARLEQAAGRPAETLHWLDKVTEQAEAQNISRFVSYTACWRAQIGLWQNNPAFADEWQAHHPSGFDHTPHFLEQQDFVTYGYFLIQQARSEEALHLAKVISQTAEQNHWQTFLIQGLLMQAQAYILQGDQNNALEKIEQAVTQAEVGNYMRVFLNAGSPVFTLLKLLEKTVVNLSAFPLDYLKKLLTAFEKELVPPAESAPLELPAESSANALLSRRELEVLQLIAEGYTNKEIASQLIVAASTVKTHVDKIFFKLGVTNRAQAISEAKKLHVL